MRFFSTILLISFFNLFAQGDMYEGDTISFPFKSELYVNIMDLKDVEIKNNFFTAKFYYELNFDKDISLFEDEEYSNPLNYVQLEFFEQPGSEISEYTRRDSLSYIRVIDYTKFNHNWNVRYYPFDKPELELVFESSYDTAFFSIDAKENKFFDFESPRNLKDGFSLDNISYKKIYTEDKGSLDDNPVYEKLIFKINLKRGGSWLYLKLFLGSFLSFIISWLVFFIPRKEFESRVELSTGAIFGAVGNRAYVESIIPDVQVLTTADMVNNLSIFLIVFNIILFMVQKNNNITWKFFESNFNSAVYSFYLFILFNLSIIFWSIFDAKLLIVFLTLILVILGTKLPSIIDKIKSK